mmetsp:Transcript_10553/g.19228  ORF Transcript_10553/g.19228 Transcript_10553/m.19228 type:complete len:296 (-) Transcript_10553:47-934(-)
MCLVVFGWDVHPEYRLIMASNRDEFYARPTDRASWWKSGKILSGRDGLSGGTWLGVSPTGRFAAVTNYRDGLVPESTHARSRGLLITEWLLEEQDEEELPTTVSSPQQFLKKIVENSQEYNGFNLIIGDTQSLWYYSNRSETNEPVQITKPGMYGLSNGLLETPWPKVARAKTKLEQVIHSSNGTIIDHSKLLEVMSDTWRPPDEDLPDTNVGELYERFLSSIFIQMADFPTSGSVTSGSIGSSLTKKSTNLSYGTNSSNILTIDYNKKVQFTERTFNEEGEVVTPDEKFTFVAA